MPSLPIAIVQSCVGQDVGSNGLRIREFLKDAREAGVRVVHFTEGALSGYVKAQIERWDDVDWPLLDEELAKGRLRPRAGRSALRQASQGPLANDLRVTSSALRYTYRVELEDRAGLDDARRLEIEAAVAEHAVLDRVIKWGFGCDPPRVISRVVVQDEYTHDVVLPWGDGLFLVYDCT